jgi:acetyl-CoA carboxylase biotin carboxyl carrier protein
MELNQETIKALLDAFSRSDWQEMTVTIGDDRLHVSRTPASANGTGPANAVDMTTAAPAPPAAPQEPAPPSGGAQPPAEPPPASEPAAAPEPEPAAAPAATVTPPPPGVAVESPSVGLFWRAPAPGAAPFVEVGRRVKAGETVAIVEVMKLMNHVVAPVDGVVSAILVENGAPVEHGQALVIIDPEG